MDRSPGKIRRTEAPGVPPAGPDNAYLATLLDHVNDGAVGADADSRITYWGRGAERMYGFTAVEAVGNTTLELLRPSYRPGEREKIFADMEREGSALAVLHTKHKNGAEIIAEVHSTALSDADGRHTGYVVIYRDVTERYRASEALREANEQLGAQAQELRTREEQLLAQGSELHARAEEIRMSEMALRGILNAAKESIWQFTPDGVILMGNKVALERFGRTAEEAVGRNFAEFVSPELAVSRQARLREVAESRRAVEFEDARGRFSFEHSFYPVFDAGGKVASIVCFSREITERKRAETALRESEARASDLVKYAPTGIYEIDFRGPAFTRVNEAMCRILGYTRDELFALSPTELLDEESRARFADRVRRQMAGEKIEEAVEYRVRRKDGQFITALLNVTISPTPLDPHKVQVIAHDITERKRMEEALVKARNEAEMRARELEIIMEAVPAGVMITRDREGLRISGNKATHELLRIRPGEDNISKSAPDPGGRRGYRPFRNGIEVPPEELPIQKAARGHEVRDWDCDIVLDDGEVRHVVINAAPLQREGEEFRGAVGTLMDVTDLRRGEQALRERGLELQRLMEGLESRVRERTAELAAANERLKAEADERARLVAAVEQADEGLVVMDAEGRIRDVNAAFTRLSGRGRDELLAMSYRELLPRSPEGDESWEKMRVSIERKEIWRGHFSRGDDGGDPLELDVTLSPIHDAAGRVINYLAVERDVTREIRLQQHLRQIQKLEALGTLAGGIAHDFNNILNPIFISTELLLLEPSLDPSCRRNLEITLTAAERGRDLVKQIIAFSRQKEKERKPSKAGPVVSEAVKFLRVSLPSTIEIRSDVGDEAGVILGDQAQIHQIVMNLCNNAAYAMREKGGVLSVGLADVEVDERLAAQAPALKPGPYLRLTVTDTGTGMTPQVRERAFDPFFTTKKAGEGSGMGLAVVAGIVRDYDGALSFTSEEGKGSAFTIYLPRVAVEGPAPEAVAKGPTGGAERILLVDDEVVQVRSVRSMLTRLGYAVVSATDGQDALDRFKSDPRSFDLVITDQTMPHVTGIRLAEEMLGLRPELPIILCTGYSETVDAAGARALGIREFLMKPYSVREMAETIRRALSKGPGETTPPGRYPK